MSVSVWTIASGLPVVLYLRIGTWWTGILVVVDILAWYYMGLGLTTMGV